ncbi:hypothetical protein IP87_16535 [beta proteobacterium AAP121]|nr:hypothetical protein IP80_00255 [beta proteobacterium AAP65]KPF95540.1 hypothetical protein IP87_16535 [beta proteobacterium AAP121]
MLRFVPDTWLDGLLRPFLMIDPVASLYTEIHAPDFRFALLIVFFLIALTARQRLSVLNVPQWSALLGLFAAFYLWTAVSGNARYFLWGLMLVGPMLVVVARELPATVAMRNTTIAGALALQGLAVWMTYEPNVWALRPWSGKSGLELERTPLSDRPAVFLTIGAISHSILVPQMHTASRWSNVSGQQDLVPGMREYVRLQALIDLPLPKYGVIRATRLVMTEDKQPIDEAWGVIRRALLRQGLAPVARPCTFARASIAGLPFELKLSQEHESGFWFCELEKSTAPAAAAQPAMFAPEFDDVFLQVERRCPRFFPVDDARTRPGDDGVLRHYSRSDTTIYVHHDGTVYFKHMRSINPSVLGPVAKVRSGDFSIDCVRLPGRYAPPWARD